LSKEFGTSWSIIADNFPGRSENQVKNRFYSTLRRVATKKITKDRLPYKSSIQMRKQELLRYVDDALLYGRDCYSQRGRKKKARNTKSNIQYKEAEKQNNESNKTKHLPSISTILKMVETPVTTDQKGLNVNSVMSYQSGSATETSSFIHSQLFLLNALMQYRLSTQPITHQIPLLNSSFPVNYEIHKGQEERADHLEGK